MKLEAEAIVRSCRLLARVEEPGLAKLADMAVIREYDRGTPIFRQGDPCPGVFIVGTGLVRVFLIAPNGKEHVLHLVGPGHTFAEVAALGDFACPAWSEAVTASTCLLLPNEPFQRALSDDPVLCRQLLTSFAFWVRHFIGLVEDITLRDAAGRVARFLLDTAGEHGSVARLPTLKKDLASRFNLTSETFSRTLRRLTDEGLIAPGDDGNELLLLDRRRLEKVRDGLGPEL